MLMRKFKIHLTACNSQLEFEYIEEFIKARNEEINTGNGFTSYVETSDDNGNITSISLD